MVMEKPIDQVTIEDGYKTLSLYLYECPFFGGHDGQKVFVMTACHCVDPEYAHEQFVRIYANKAIAQHYLRYVEEKNDISIILKELKLI